MFQEQSRKYINYGDAGINEKGNGGEIEEMGTTTEGQRGVFEADFRIREQRWEQMLKQRDEGWK